MWNAAGDFLKSGGAWCAPYQKKAFADLQPGLKAGR
jgi:hypothetical protein